MLLGRIRKLEDDKQKLVDELNVERSKGEREQEKIEDLYCQIQNVYREKEVYMFQSKEVIKDLLVKVEDHRRRDAIRELTDEKGRLGFFSFTNSFGRNMEDWIDGVAVRSLKDQIVGLSRKVSSGRKSSWRSGARSASSGRRPPSPN